MNAIRPISYLAPLSRAEAAWHAYVADPTRSWNQPKAVRRPEPEPLRLEFKSIHERQAHRAATINDAIDHGRTVELPLWGPILRAYPRGAQVLLHFVNGREWLIGTEANDTFTLIWKPGQAASANISIKEIA